MSSEIWFGVHAPPEGRDFEEMKLICREVEEEGFDLFSITDHFMNMRKPEGPGNHPLECWSTLAGLAAVTDKIRLAPLVSCYGYRRPTVLAKIATTVDIISNGRLIFGIGAGWHEEEFRGFMGRFPSTSERLLGLRETVKICKEMFSFKHTTYYGKHYQIENVLNSPQPVQRPVPIMIGGGGEKVTLRIAAEHADISHFFSENPNALERKLSILKAHCEVLGRNYGEIKKATSISLLLESSGSEEAEMKLRRRAESSGLDVEAMRDRLGIGFGTPEKVADGLKEYADKGIGLFTIRFSDLDEIKLFSKEVMSQF